MTGRSEGGFTLMEALVALVILIAMTTLLYRGLSSALRLSAVADRSEAALLLAKARLASAGSETPLQQGQASGVEGGLAWSVDTQPYASALSSLPPGPAAFWITVTVSWRDGAGRPRTIELKSLKLAR